MVYSSAKDHYGRAHGETAGRVITRHHISDPPKTQPKKDDVPNQTKNSYFDIHAHHHASLAERLKWESERSIRKNEANQAIKMQSETDIEMKAEETIDDLLQNISEISDIENSIDFDLAQKNNEFMEQKTMNNDFNNAMNEKLKARINHGNLSSLIKSSDHRMEELTHELDALINKIKVIRSSKKSPIKLSKSILKKSSISKNVQIEDAQNDNDDTDNPSVNPTIFPTLWPTLNPSINPTENISHTSIANQAQIIGFVSNIISAMNSNESVFIFFFIFVSIFIILFGIKLRNLNKEQRKEENASSSEPELEASSDHSETTSYQEDVENNPDTFTSYNYSPSVKDSNYQQTSIFAKVIINHQSHEQRQRQRTRLI